MARLSDCEPMKCALAASVAEQLFDEAFECSSPLCRCLQVPISMSCVGDHHIGSGECPTLVQGSRWSDCPRCPADCHWMRFDVAGHWLLMLMSWTFVGAGRCWSGLKLSGGPLLEAEKMCFLVRGSLVGKREAWLWRDAMQDFREGYSL